MCKLTIPENATLDEKRSLCFNALYDMNIGDKVEKKDNLSYLTWSEAWKAFKEVYPSATFRVITNPDTKLPYFVDPSVGFMVFTEVTADDMTQQCFLPVLNSSMKPMRLEAYNYTVYDKQNKRQIEKTCEGTSMFDINKTIMRCLVKNLALFGLGLKLYQGEDIPCENEDAVNNTADSQKTMTRRARTVAAQPAPQPAQPVDRFSAIKNAINSVSNTDALLDLFLQHENEALNNPDIKALFTARKQQLKQAA